MAADPGLVGFLLALDTLKENLELIRDMAEMLRMTVQPAQARKKVGSLIEVVRDVETFTSGARDAFSKVADAETMEEVRKLSMSSRKTARDAMLTRLLAEHRLPDKPD